MFDAHRATIRGALGVTNRKLASNPWALHSHPIWPRQRSVYNFRGKSSRNDRFIGRGRKQLLGQNRSLTFVMVRASIKRGITERLT